MAARQVEMTMASATRAPVGLAVVAEVRRMCAKAAAH